MKTSVFSELLSEFLQVWVWVCVCLLERERENSTPIAGQEERSEVKFKALRIWGIEIKQIKEKLKWPEWPHTPLGSAPLQNKCQHTEWLRRGTRAKAARTHTHTQWPRRETRAKAAHTHTHTEDAAEQAEQRGPLKSSSVHSTRPPWAPDQPHTHRSLRRLLTLVLTLHDLAVNDPQL